MPKRIDSARSTANTIGTPSSAARTASTSPSRSSDRESRRNARATSEDDEPRAFQRGALVVLGDGPGGSRLDYSRGRPHGRCGVGSVRPHPPAGATAPHYEPLLGETTEDLSSRRPAPKWLRVPAPRI